LLLLRPEIVQNLDTVEGLRCALQTAIKLEHSTIPPYLYALYSLKPGRNASVADIIDSVVAEEMLHMSLACNVLNAIGGAPQIDTPDFVPDYPGPLPGTVQAGLIVHLAPFSKSPPDSPPNSSVLDVFMTIEEPEDPQKYPVVPHAMLMAEAAKPITIGKFYHSIVDQMTELSKTQNIFTGNPTLQLQTTFTQIPLIAVTDLATATKAIHTIVDQGEGTPTNPFELGKAPAHYYRYAEINNGRQLVSKLGCEAPYEYRGAIVHFDEDGVWPCITDPALHPYVPGSPAAIYNAQFNAAYTQILQTLHQVFNGKPDRIATAVLNMLALKQQAGFLTGLDLGNGTHAGPSFEYTPAPAPEGRAA
jgi:hypothetical protein